MIMVTPSINKAVWKRAAVNPPSVDRRRALLLVRGKHRMVSSVSYRIQGERMNLIALPWHALSLPLGLTLSDKKRPRL